MANNKNIWLFWLLALLITLSSAIYQRKTGPNHPKYVNTEMGSEEYRLKCIRSSALDQVCLIEFEIPDTEVSGTVYYKRYPTNEPYIAVPMERNGDQLSVILPDQPSAGKLAYFLEFEVGGQASAYQKEDPIIIRFNDAVPGYVMIPHIFFMFFAMLLSNLMAILAIARREQFVLYLTFSFIAFTVGGMILGPVVQKFAFGEYWTGFPNGMDLTDNKTLIAWIFMLAAVLLNIKKKRPVIAIIAAVVMLAVYLIPHSMLGSELDPTTGEIIQA
jgi:hypothetical protein